MPASALTQKLIQIPIFRGLTEQEATSIIEMAEETSVKKGDTLFKEGEAGDALYVVLEGSVHVLKKDRAGTEQELAKMGDGSVLGEMSLVAGSANRSASAVALSDVKLLRVSSQRFSKLLAANEVGALKVVHNLAQVLSRRLQLMDEKLVDLLDKGKRKEELAEFQRILSNWSF
ncbi:MAG TPA: cyclic nucleotide-binding domain-containing protein [Myxococcaceae bacterium]|nr:cyclic nucleotide-binding domain-containing protein [Myxococcaceae bacterium]